MTLDVTALVDQLTIEEKASLLIGADFWHTKSIERLDVPSVMVSDGPHGLRKQPEESDNLGLGNSIPATCFPTASAIGSSWDVDLVRRVGQALGREAAAERIAVLLGPGINMKRSPLCGRNFEYLSEDPHLAGRLGAAMVEGVQGEGVGTSLKHYAANNQETDRLRVSAEVDERTLREIYLPAFEHVVQQTQPWTVMCCYNKVNGTFGSEHHWLLTEVLRDEWGFRGLVVSDWGAVHDRVASVAAGLDLEMPPNLGVSDKAIVDAVEAGTLSEATVDASVRRVLELVERAAAADPAPVDFEAHHALAREAAANSIVLLKNDEAVLPLSGQGRIAVVGEFARTPRYQGAGSSQVNPTRVDSALDALTATYGDDLTFAAGFGVGTTDDDTRLSDEALAVAEAAELVLLFLGLPAADESEGFDRTHLDLPANQTDLLQRIAAVGARVVVVLANGSTVAVSGWEQQATAIVECWLGGQASGSAVADVLLGTVNPSGRLAETVPVRLEDNSSYLNFPGGEGEVRYGEGVFIGYRGYDAAGLAVSYPFGHGLSYTTFGYSDLTVSVSGSVEGGDLAVAVGATVTNTGSVTGREVVQLYVGDDDAVVQRPDRELKGFTKVSLEPGATTSVAFTLDARDFSYWSIVTGGWLVEPGEFTISVGGSSRDLPLRESVHLDAPKPDAALGPMSTLQEFLDDAAGHAALVEVVGTDADGAVNGIFGDEGHMRVIGNFPISTWAGFPGGLGHDTLQKILAAVPEDHRA